MANAPLLRLDASAAVIGGELVEPASVLVDRRDGRVVAAGPPARVGEAANDVDRVEGTLVPGYVDLQLNGAAGHDFRHEDTAGALRALAAILATGTTTVCPTMPTQPADRYLRAMAAVAEAAGTDAALPRVPGVHLEGPFLAHEQRGAHRSSWLQAPSLDLVEQVLGAGTVPVAIWTLAPELPGTLDVIHELHRAGVVVSAGHTAADDDALDAASDAGLSMVTHLANGMPPFHHRRPGPVGWALAHPSVRAGLILDGHHLHATTLGLFRLILGGRAFGVTDAVATLGLAPGRHDVDGEVLDTTTGVTRLGGPEGTIAGACTGMDRMVAALCSRSSDLVDVVRLCSTTPADAIARPDLGRIAPGAHADLLALDATFTISRMWLAGREVTRA